MAKSHTKSSRKNKAPPKAARAPKPATRVVIGKGATPPKASYSKPSQAAEKAMKEPKPINKAHVKPNGSFVTPTVNGSAFSPGVSTKLRRLVAMIDQAKIRRKDLFDARDYAEEQINEADSDADRQTHESEYGRCVLEIHKWNRAIKALENDVGTTIREAEQLKLHDDDVGQVMIEDYLNSENDAGDDDEPTGPIRTKPGKVKPIAPDPELGDGEAQHFAASVNDLDMREDLKGRLASAGLMKVGNLVGIVDRAETPGDAAQRIASEADMTDEDGEIVVLAVERFRKAHRRADFEVEREAVGAES